MGHSSKWISGTRPGQPLTHGAREALRQRFDAMWPLARRASTDWKQDVEHVHQLRVATRRATAAMDLFGDLIARTPARKMKRRLRDLRRAAGEARDLDVLRERLESMGETPSGSSLESVIKMIRRQRTAAQKPLRQVTRRARKKHWKRKGRQVVKSVRWCLPDDEPRFRDAARIRLQPLVDEFFSRGRGALDEIDQLHALRIAGKRVRYAMELLAGAFDESFRRDLYNQFVHVQETLGELNDHAVALERFQQWMQAGGRARDCRILAELTAVEHHEVASCCSAFRESWSSQQIEALMSSFHQTLSLPAN